MKVVKALRIAALAAVATLAFTGRAQAQPELPQAITVPVTFYDFRSDRSNPEFEQPHQGGRRTGMVADLLDADNKPQVGPNPYRNYGIAHWFRPWESYNAPGPNFFGRGSNMAPAYNPTPGIRQTHSNEWGSTVQYLGVQNVGHDTSFKNIMIPGELEFRLVNAATGMYEFSRRGNTPFFPLDGRGFGNEWHYICGQDNRLCGQRNFAFTMELAFTFQVRRDMVFNFEGDDDVWVFINNQLVLDIGGIHSPIADNFTLNTALLNRLGLAHGNMAILRVFYAERHSEGSNIWIQTNIIAPPSSVNISTVGNDGGPTGRDVIPSGGVDKPADQTVTLYSVVYDDMGRALNPVAGDYKCEDVTWHIDGRLVHTGCSYNMADSIARTVNITVTYNDRQNPPVSRVANVNVKALSPAFVTIQRENVARVPAACPVYGEDIYFNPGEDATVVYAVLLDRYCNYTGFLAENRPRGGPNDWYSEGAARWSTENHDVATVNPSNGTMVNVRKEFLGEGTESRLVVQYRACGGDLGNVCRDLADTVAVGSKSVGAISVGPNPFIPRLTTVEEAYRGTSVPAFYRNAIEQSPSKGKGLLIAVDAPKPLVGPGGVSVTQGGTPQTRYGSVTIYDAVGNVVHKAHLFWSGSAARSYGYVWDGKNSKGREVGPGTYLVRVVGRDTDGKRFSMQRMVGVTKE